MSENNGFKSFFIRGLIIIMIVIVFLFIGGALTLGILSVINKVSPSDLLKGFTGNEEQVTPEQKTQEDE